MEMHPSSSTDESSEPIMPPDSPGSCVSSRLQEEYDELLKYAVIMPSYDPGTIPKTLSDIKGSFPGMSGLSMQYPGHTCGEGEEGDDEEEYASTKDDEDTLSEGGLQPAPGAGGMNHLEQSTPLEGQSPQPTDEDRMRHRFHGDRIMEGLAAQLFTSGEPELDSPRSSRSDAEPRTPSSEVVAFTMSVDQDVARMDSLLDQWTGDLKRNVLAEFGQAKIKLLQHQRQQMQKEKERHSADMNHLQNDMEGLKELLHTYEKSIERKDQVISNLTRGLQKQKEKYDMSKTFCDWKVRHNDMRREAFASNLAEKHYERGVLQRCWDGWHSVVESRWKQRVEKACQAKAQEVCMTLTNDYESRIASLNEALESARQEVNRLHGERDGYEETMKKAFMRGVCALNMEAMSMFNEADSKGQTGVSNGTSGDGEYPAPDGATDDGQYAPYTIQQEAVYMSNPPGAPPARVVSRVPPTSGQSITVQAKHPVTTAKTKATGRGKVITAKVSARGEAGRAAGQSLGGGASGLAPPMSSVIVERHPPVTKQTIGHATASKYPKSSQQQAAPTPPAIVQRKIAGQAGSVQLATPNVQTIKVVE